MQRVPPQSLTDVDLWIESAKFLESARHLPVAFQRELLARFQRIVYAKISTTLIPN